MHGVHASIFINITHIFEKEHKKIFKKRLEILYIYPMCIKALMLFFVLHKKVHRQEKKNLKKY